MKTRRGFLTALGLGAAAAPLVFTGTARAWGRRRRRCQDSCNESCKECGTKLKTYTGTTSCDCACPIYLYTQANGIYYYYCSCWVGGQNKGYVIAPSSYYYPPSTLPIQPSSGKCIGDCSKGTMLKIYTVHDECGFHLDPDAKDPQGKNYHDAAFMTGIDSQSSGDLDKEIRKNLTGSNITGYNIVKFSDPAITVSLYDIHSDSAPHCDLHIGFQVSDMPPAKDADEFGTPYEKKFKHYRHVYFGTYRYHVVTSK